MNSVTIIILIVLGIICAIIHKNKGYSPVAGFAWGFLFSILGLIVVLLEKDKKDRIGKQGLQMWQWVIIFLVIGTVLIAIFILPMSRPKDRIPDTNYSQNQEDMGNKTLQIKYSSNIVINNNFENIENLFFHLKNKNWSYSSDYKTSRTYLNIKDNMFLAIICKDINDKDIESYITDRFKNISTQKQVEAKRVLINNAVWHMFNYADSTGYNIFYVTDYNDKRYEIEFTIDNRYYSKGVKNIEEFVNTLKLQ